MRTDTIYGLLARANDEAAVEKIYRLKNRAADKQCIVLIASASDVPRYGMSIEQYSLGEKLPTSVVVPASDEPAWLLRGGKDIAYRIVRSDFLRAVIEQTGPLVAPSANPEGRPPARSVAEAQNYFGDKVDMYVDGGTVPRTIHPSRIIRLNKDGSLETLR